MLSERIWDDTMVVMAIDTKPISKTSQQLTYSVLYVKALIFVSQQYHPMCRAHISCYKCWYCGRTKITGLLYVHRRATHLETWQTEEDTSTWWSFLTSMCDFASSPIYS